MNYFFFNGMHNELIDEREAEFLNLSPAFRKEIIKDARECTVSNLNNKVR